MDVIEITAQMWNFPLPFNGEGNSFNDVFLLYFSWQKIEMEGTNNSLKYIYLKITTVPQFHKFKPLQNRLINLHSSFIIVDLFVL